MIILIIGIVCFLSNETYTFINNNFDSEVTNSYVTEINSGPGNGSFESYYFFCDENGVEKCYTEKYLIFENFAEGDAVYVNEYKGLFGVEHYKLKKLNQ
ncbi:MAG: hypothetical protein PUE08_04115 [Eubacteriales bacterium]|nr:hypothetical protein [Eubacteriales bacterium]